MTDASDSLVHHLLNSTNDALFVVGPTDAIAYANASAAKVLGATTTDDLIGRLWAEFGPGCPTGSAHECSQEPLRAIDGSIVFAFVRVEAPRPDGTSVIVVRDDREQRAERQALERLFEQTPVPLVILEGPEHRFKFANSTYINTMLGGRDVIGQTVAEAIPEVIAQGRIDLLDEVFRTGQPRTERERPVRLRQADGRTKCFIIDVSYQPTRDPRGVVTGILIMAIDVTDQILVRERLRESERYFRDLVDVSPAMIWITDEHSRCTYLSRQWFEYTGRTPDQDLGFGWMDCIHPEDIRQASPYAQATEDRGTLRTDYRLRRRDGEFRWFIDVGYPRYDQGGNFLGYIGSMTDAHDRITAEREVKDLQDRFRRSAQATDLGVWYCDLPLADLNWNEITKAQFFTPPDVSPTIELFYSRVHPDDRERVRHAIDRSTTLGELYDVTFRTVNPADPREVRSVRNVGWIDRDAFDRPIRFDGISLDVTNLLARQNELRDAKEAAENANAAKSAFLANMSHEIRTPLGAILGFTDLMRDASLSHGERDQFLETVARNGRALTRIIDDILDLAKVESGKLEIERVEFDFEALIADAVELFRGKVASKGLTLNVAWGPGVPRRLRSDPTRLRQILINLIGNAVKFTHEGSVTVEVAAPVPVVDATSDRLTFSILVHDTGVGIAREHRDRLFQPFMQADGTTTRKYGGTGLGLVLSNRLARAMGGAVTIAACELGVGCTFQITFVADLPTAEAPASGPDAPVVARTERPLDGVSVLLADDSEDNRELVKHVLSAQGARVGLAKDGIEAYRAALKGAYDVVLMDIQMPGMDGYEATRSLRDAGFGKPIIALTAFALVEEHARTRAAGCNGHLTKPLVTNELVRVILEQMPLSN